MPRKWADHDCTFSADDIFFLSFVYWLPTGIGVGVFCLGTGSEPTYLISLTAKRLDFF